MIRKMYLINWVLLSMLLIACNKTALKKIEKTEDKISENTEVNDRIKYEIIFPDTVIIGKEYFGEINYQSSLDSVSTQFGIKGKNRYVRFIMTSTESINYDLKYLKTIVKDTFGAYDNRTIDILLKYRKPGIYYIDGLINDLVFIDLHKKDENGEELVRWIEDEVRVTKKVVVIDKE